MSTTDELLKNAQAYAASFDKGELPLPPARKVAVVACMDARLNHMGCLVFMRATRTSSAMRVA